MVQWHNTLETYGAVSRIFHWGMAFIMVGLMATGLYMMNLPASPTKWQYYSLHKSFGLVILMAAVLRLTWRHTNLKPELPTTLYKLERNLMRLTDLGLYGGMILMPLSGYLMSVWGGFPIDFFGLGEVPALVSKNLKLAKLAREAHTYISYGIYGLLALHVLGTLYHHFILKDTVLRRMLGY